MEDRPIIVGGVFRSGTTLVRRILDSHSRIHCGPEVKFFMDFYGAYARDNLSHLRLFSTARTYGLPEPELLTIFGNAYIAFHERAASHAGKVRWAEKNPENVLYLQKWQVLLPKGFFFIHVIRHPLDTLTSLKEAGFPLTVPADFRDKVRLYKKYRDAGEAYCRANRETSITIAYEDLVTSPASTVEYMFQRLGETFEPMTLTDFHLPERGTGIEDSKIARTRTIHAHSIGRWISGMSPDEVSEAKDILGPLFRQ